MIAKDELKLLQLYNNRGATFTGEGISGIESLAVRQCEDLRGSIECDGRRDRRIAAGKSMRLWRVLTADLQEKYVRLYSGIWNCHILEGRLDLALRASKRARRVGGRGHKKALEAEGWLGEGLVALMNGNPKEAVRNLEISRALFNSTRKNSIDSIRASILLGSAYRIVGDKHSAMGVLKRARSESLAMEDVPLLGAVSQTLGVLHSECGYFREAISCFEFVVQSATVLSSNKRALRGKLGLCKCYVRTGRVKEAYDLAILALEMATQLELQREVALANEYIADCHMAKKEWSKALRRMSKVNKIVVRSPSADMKCELHRKLADLWLRAGHVRYAEFHIRKGLESSEGGIEDDVKALQRLKIECAWASEKGRTALPKLICHAQDAKELGLMYEYLLTTRSIAAIATLQRKASLAREWWRQVEFSADICSASDLAEDWKRDCSYLSGFAKVGCDPSKDEQFHAAGLSDDLQACGIVTRSRELLQQAAWLKKLAPTNLPILVRGESGTGKELFAKLAHAMSVRSNGPYLAVNCGALPPSLLESELFGYRKGAFTGADGSREGLFRAVNHGTLFLDEIGEMSITAQTKLLRVLETGEFRRVGSSVTETVDVRIVAATNLNLEKAVRENSFRKDLYYRLKGLELVLPALRDRLTDIPLLADKFLSDINIRNNQSLEIPFDTKQWLIGLPWPGNVRELKLAVERAAAMAPTHGQLLPQHFVCVDGYPKRKSLPSELEEIERARVNNALEVSEWNVTNAARLLGMTRTTLSSRLGRLGIRRPRKGTQ